MIGTIPAGNKTYEIHGDFNISNPVEGKLYYHPETKRLYYYSTKFTRSNPNVGYFPIWNGKRTYESKFSNNKTLNDINTNSIEELAAKINKSVAETVKYNQRRIISDVILKPAISDGDNFFTQCIKEVITGMNITMIDLVDMCNPKLTQKQIENYYSALTKIAFMRIDKWDVWINVILHVGYIITIRKDNKKIMTYTYPENKFDTGIVKYDSIANSKMDPLKKTVKIVSMMENITKTTLRSNEGVDDYTINNMMTTLNGDKALSAQLFSRFIRMAGLTFSVDIVKDGKIIFTYRE